MLTMRELAVAEDGDGEPRVTIVDGGETTRFRVAAAQFEDATTFFPMLGEYEVWQLINLTGDTHPIHLHLDPFQILARRSIRYEIPESAGDDDGGRGGAVSLLPRLEVLRYRAAIVGPHGSGKTTLLEDLEGVLAARGFRIQHVRLDTEPVPNAVDGRHALEMILAAYASHETGARVAFPYAEAAR